MAREERPVSPEQIPEEARQYILAIQSHEAHPLVRQHFHQVTWLTLTVPGQGNVNFFALEFRIGRSAALVWEDGQGNWGAGRWVSLSHENADITCPPSPLSLAYFQNAQANPSLEAALDLLTASERA